MIHAIPLLDVDASAASEDAGFGALETSRGCLPLVSLDVRCRIVGLFARVSLRQTFRNAFDEPMEATYIFPLPDRAAVSRFRMTVGERVIEGELKERGQAREEYDAAIEQGHRAAIAEEERSGVFTMRVGNLGAGEEATVELDLVGPLDVSRDEATWRFPLVVAPRYTPGAPLDGPAVGDGVAMDTDQVPDASRVTPPVLLPGFPNPVRLALEVELDPAGLASELAGVRSSLHAVAVKENGPPWTIRLQPGERLNRDFILRFPVTAGSVRTTLQCSPATKKTPGAFALTLAPPAMADARPKPREVVFLLDRSGSMSGWKIVAARRALGRMIDTLLDEDQFTVIAFDDRMEHPPEASQSLVSGANRNRWRVLEWLGKIDARGGTEMGPALKAAVKCFSRATAEVDRVLVVVTDGQVSGEDALLKTLKRSAGKAMPRIFTLGIDQAVNAGFLRRLADMGGGLCDLVESEDRLDEALEGIHRRMGQPVLTDVRLELLDFDGVADSLAPSRLAGLYADRPLTVFGRHLGETTQVRLRVHATDAAGNPWSDEVTARPAPADLLLNLWGRARVRELEDRYAAEEGCDEKLADQIVSVSLESGVLSRFTAYVAVDRSEVVNPGGKQHHIVQPVEFPAQWEEQSDMVFSPPAPPPSAKLTRFPLPGSVQQYRKQSNIPASSDVSVDSCLQGFDNEHSFLADDLDLERVEDAGRAPEPSSPLAAMAVRLLTVVNGVRQGSFRVSNLRLLLNGLRLATEQLGAITAPPTRLEFAQLVEALSGLAQLVANDALLSAPDVERLAKSGRELLDEWDAAGDIAPVRDRVMSYLEDVVRSLANPPEPPKSKRKGFWKSSSGNAQG